MLKLRKFRKNVKTNKMVEKTLNLRKYREKLKKFIECQDEQLELKKWLKPYGIEKLATKTVEIEELAEKSEKFEEIVERNDQN